MRRVEPVEHRRGGGVVLRRLAVDEVTHPFDRGAQRAKPRLLVGLRRVEPQPGPQRGGQRVGQPAGLGQRDGQGPGRDRSGARRQRGCAGAAGRRAAPRPGSTGAPARWRRPARSPRWPPGGRGGRPPPSTAPSRAAGRRCRSLRRPRRAPPRRSRRAPPCGRRARRRAPRGSAARPGRPSGWPSRPGAVGAVAPCVAEITGPVRRPAAAGPAPCRGSRPARCCSSWSTGRRPASPRARR